MGRAAAQVELIAQPRGKRAAEGEQRAVRAAAGREQRRVQGSRVPLPGHNHARGGQELERPHSTRVPVQILEQRISSQIVGSRRDE